MAPEPQPPTHRSYSLESLPDRISGSSAGALEEDAAVVGITLIAKYKKERIEITDLHPLTTILEVKEMLQEQTNILTKRQKLVGLLAREGGTKGVCDTLTLSELQWKGSASQNGVVAHQFILMGTPEEAIFVDPLHRDDLPDVIDDFELDFTAGSEEWLNHVANGEKLAQFTEHTMVHLMNQPRQGKHLLVLDLDHTLLDFSSRHIIENGGVPGSMKRPFMDQFLTRYVRVFVGDAMRGDKTRRVIMTL
jgi:ubiquitin-like domain-containing CTD phosphatase 1